MPKKIRSSGSHDRIIQAFERTESLTLHCGATTMAACATRRNVRDRELAVRLTFIGKDPDSNPTGSQPCTARIPEVGWCRDGS